ncbi:MAG TPA: biotin--[acetyl-CoA-carboxylase] ligase [Candidatus Limnocylindria bacterium]|nr:biotin--[acetyl-CoA-carboxylase] ligase [Candidatus Limnocylindria bacterium]
MTDPRPTGSEPLPDWAAAARPGRRVGNRVEFHPEIGSTNDRARAELAEGGPDGLAVVADRQLAGRGRMGRTWLSPAGVNLLVSVGLRLDLSAERAWWLAAGAALALRFAAQEAVGPATPLSVRWPNDLVTSDGLKVSGLLVETEIEGARVAWSVIGMGLNVNWRRRDMPSDIASGATSLADLAGRDVDRVALLGALLAALDGEVSRIEAGASPQARFQSASWLTGREIEVETPAGRLAGVAGPIADNGGLMLDGPMIRTTVTVGEVIRVHATAVAG